MIGNSIGIGFNDDQIASSPVSDALLLTFDDIANAALLIDGDASLVDDWNTFWAEYNEDPFTGVSISGNIVNLQGGIDLSLPSALYISEYKPDTIVDTLGVVIILYLQNTLITEPPVLTGLMALERLRLDGSLITAPPILTGLLALEQVYLDSIDGFDLSDIDTALAYFATLYPNLSEVALSQDPPIIPTPATLAAAEAANPQCTFYVDIAAPAALSATVISDTEIDLNCTATEALSYEISEDGENYSEVGTTEKGITLLHVTELTAGMLYYFRVRAVKNEVYSAYSDVVSATTDETP